MLNCLKKLMIKVIAMTIERSTSGMLATTTVTILPITLTKHRTCSRFSIRLGAI